MVSMIIFATIVAALLLAAALAQLRRRTTLRVLDRGSRIAFAASGPVEFAALGSGPPVLLLHGGCGGWDQGAMLAISLLKDADESIGYDDALREADSILDDRFTVIAPSRAGYLRTPLSTGRTPAEGADTMAGLLDTLGVTRVLVVGVSGGGPTALQFALRHQRRCAALVMAAAISKRHFQPPRTTNNFVGKAVFARGAGWFVDALVATVFAYLSVRPMVQAQEQYQESLETNVTRDVTESVTRTVEGASVEVLLTISDRGTIPFTVRNLEITGLIQDPFDRRSFQPLASLLPASVLEDGNDFEVSLGPLIPQRGPFIFKNTEVFPSLVEDLMKSPRGLIFAVANYDIEDEAGRNLAFISQQVNDRTAGLVVDYGNGTVDRFRISTQSPLTINACDGASAQEGAFCRGNVSRRS